MQINQVSNQLKALISEKHLIKLAKTSGFQVRHRCLSIVSLLKAVFKSLSCLQDANLSDIHQNLRMQANCTISYKPFHNQIRKPALTELVREHVIQAMSKLTVNTRWIKPFLPSEEYSECYCKMVLHLPYMMN